MPEYVFDYVCDLDRRRIYGLIRSEFDRSGLSQAELALRMGKRPEQINRILNAPTNWTINTVAKLLFAMSGAIQNRSLDYPCEAPPANQREPEWLEPRLELQQETALVGGIATKLPQTSTVGGAGKRNPLTLVAQ